jgi:hypothetical protein
MGKKTFLVQNVDQTSILQGFLVFFTKLWCEGVGVGAAQYHVHAGVAENPCTLSV